MKKMYILLLDILDTGHAVNTAAHAGAMIQAHWPRISWIGGVEEAEESEDRDMADWYDNSFRKVTCKVTLEELHAARQVARDTLTPSICAGLPAEPMQYFEVTESAYGGKTVALVFKPRDTWPPFFKNLKLYS